MLKSELLSAILNNYKDDTGLTEAAVVEHFCTYAAKWLADNSVVGIGRAATGVSLRFADGRELSIFEDAAPVPVGNQVAVSITGNAGTARPGVTTMTDSSFPITITTTEKH